MTKRLRLLVTGNEGQLVRSLLERGALQEDIEIVALGRPALDLSVPETIEAAVRNIKPDVIVNAAAYTAVDKAETDEDLATLVNGKAAGELARVAALLNVPIVQVSTDYVFDGSKPDAYAETDAVSPLGAYGRSKLAGERAVAQATPNHVILRTAWVHSPFGKNFVKTMLQLAETRGTLGVVADQYGTPTSALDIADAIITVARNLLSSDDASLRGVFHFTNDGRASWADFAEEIFRQSKDLGGPRAQVNRIPTSAYPTPAARPTNSKLNCDKLQVIHGVSKIDWAVSTRETVTRSLSL
jgi:dTDP-4-dehydrorhamnose reductase